MLVGFESSDDAAVYRLADGLAVISTVDFITPPVDDPVWFGRIAAANSLSDIYAMGGRPVTALKEILKGGNEKVAEAGAAMAGGHSVDDDEPKYGLAVTGVVAPERILTNCGIQPGDALVLTKPLGTGVLFNACKSKRLPWAQLEAILPQVGALNRAAIEIALDFNVHACTDVTGFGLAGHALEMAMGSGLRIDLDFNALPFYPNAAEMYRKGETTGSNAANRKLVEGRLEFARKLPAVNVELLFDPQTSGGLLLSLPGKEAEHLVRTLRQAGVVNACMVGEAVAGSQPGLRVV